MVTTNIGDLSDDLLNEILCRLPCEVVFQIKRVSKRWCSLVSGHDFICRFLRLQSDKQTPKAHGVVDYGGNELFPTKAFERFRNLLLSSKKDSLVLAICNDLVLCVQKSEKHVDYYICNPRTMKVVSLPPTPGSHQLPPWGFICEPYYKETSNEGLHINAEFRFRVVRILRPRTRAECTECFKINIQVFSSETGDWRKIVVPCPQGFSYFDLSYWGSFGNNGILYWVARGSLLALRTPLMINNNKMPLVDQYRFHVIEIDLPANHNFYNPYGEFYICQLHYMGVYGGRVRLQDCNLDEEPPLLCVWELKEEELDQMVLEENQKLGSEHMKSYLLDQTMIPENTKHGSVFYIAYDSNDLDVVYLNVGKDTVKCNIRTGSWSKMAKTIIMVAILCCHGGLHQFLRFQRNRQCTQVPRFRSGSEEGAQWKRTETDAASLIS